MSNRARGTAVRSAVLAAVVIGTLVPMATPAEALGKAKTISSTFNTDTEGWVVVGDTTSVTPTFVGSGGNPGGYAQTIDQVVGGVMEWKAPAKFRGAKSQWYEG